MTKPVKPELSEPMFSDYALQLQDWLQRKIAEARELERQESEAWQARARKAEHNERELADMHEEQDRKLSEQATKLADLERTGENVAEQYERLEAKFREGQARIAELEAEAPAIRGRVATLEHDLSLAHAAMRNQENRMHDEIREWKKKAADAGVDAYEASECVERLETERNTHVAKLAEQAARIAGLESSLAQAGIKCGEAVKRIAELERELATCRLSSDGSASNVKLLHERAIKAEAELAKANERIAELEQHCRAVADSQRESVSGLLGLIRGDQSPPAIDSHFAEVSSAIGGLRFDNKRLQMRGDNLEAKLSRLKGKRGPRPENPYPLAGRETRGAWAEGLEAGIKWAESGMAEPKGAQCYYCNRGFPLHKAGFHYGTQALGMIPNTPCERPAEPKPRGPRPRMPWFDPDSMIGDEAYQLRAAVVSGGMQAEELRPWLRSLDEWAGQQTSEAAAGSAGATGGDKPCAASDAGPAAATEIERRVAALESSVAKLEEAERNRSLSENP